MWAGRPARSHAGAHQRRKGRAGSKGRQARGPRRHPDDHVILNLDLLVLRAMDEPMRHAGGVPARQRRAQAECNTTRLLAWHQRLRSATR